MLTLIAIPVYNEFCHVDDILTCVSDYNRDILVINDGSDDGTDESLKKYSFIKTITHDANEGYGQSLMDAFEYAEHKGYDWMITMDCDHQHQPACIPRFMEKIKENNADIISGSRYLHAKDNKSVPPERRLINRHLTSLLHRILNIDITDAFCGFKAYRVDILKKMKLTEKGYGLPLQLWVQAAYYGFKISEISVPLIYHDSRRNFAGCLENPEFRMQYYMNILHNAFSQYGYTNAEKPVCP